MEQAIGLKTEKANVGNLRTIAISSGKGGVGKTNLAVNMAITFRSYGKKVMLLDADLGLSNIDVVLGLTPKYNLQHVLLGEMDFKDIIIEGPTGIKIIPASTGVSELTNLDDGLKLRLLSELDDFDEDFDLLIIDTGAGISNNVLFFCSAAQEVIIIVTSEPTSLTDAYALIKVLTKDYDERHFKIIINSVRSSKEAFETFKRISLAADRYLNISLDYLGYIPVDDLIKKAVESQQAFIKLFPNSNASKNILKICDKLSSDEDLVTKGNIQFFFKKLLKH